MPQAKTVYLDEVYRRCRLEHLVRQTFCTCCDIADL